jgi:hypothetical protein
MNPVRQCWTLFRFQLAANPYIWFMAFAFCAPLFFVHTGHEWLNTLIPSQNLFFIGFLGVMLLAPELFYTAASGQWAGYSTEFLLTRAVDRTFLARAKTGCLYFITLIIPIVILALSLKNPDLKVDSYSKNEQQECVASIPGSTTLKDSSGHIEGLAIPAGNRLIAAWHCWEVVVCAAAVQILVLLIHPWPHRKFILWTIYGLVLFLPLATILPLFHPIFSHEPFFDSEHLFFIFAAHQLIFWVETLLFVFLAQLWCERRFAQLEP